MGINDKTLWWDFMCPITTTREVSSRPTDRLWYRFLTRTWPRFARTDRVPDKHPAQKPHRRGDEAFFKLQIVADYTLNEDPQPHVLFTFGFSNLKPAPSRVST